MKNIEQEILREIPDRVYAKYTTRGTPILMAYNCVLLERDTGKSFVYTAVNLTTDREEILSRRTTPLTTNGVALMVEKIRLSSVAGAGRFEADRPFGERIIFKKCYEIMMTVFKDVLPKHGYAIRKEQISLAAHILNAIYHRTVTLAEVGTGKTLAYLIPAILAKRGRLNDYCNMSLYPGVPFIEMAQMPIVVATSSIALQKAIVANYIPELSDILVTCGIVKTPLTAVIRKGREHYICRRNLRSHLPFEHNHKVQAMLEALIQPLATIDIAEIDGLTPHIKRKISVPSRCYKNCPYQNDCQYLRFRERAQSPEIDIQVCNHNYLLADTLRRTGGLRQFIPNYQCIIIDEAHKFLQVAQSMYGQEMSSLTVSDIKGSINLLQFKSMTAQTLAQKTARKLVSESNRLFYSLILNAERDTLEDEQDRFSVDIDMGAERHLMNIRDISDRLLELLDSEPVSNSSIGLKSQTIWYLEQVREQAVIFLQHANLICWLEIDNDDSRLCAILKDLNKQLYDDLWSMGVPIILTSGTLSASGDFSHIKRTLGLDYIGDDITETSKSSPFNYRANVLLYISENVPFPDISDKAYLTAVADEVERLIYAAHGHAAVLFTSYKAMDIVWEQLVQRDLPFPMFRLDKGGVREIERFKHSGNGILFASGALREGIDIPGDAFSLLIIVKLPFAVPDPIGEYEQTLYKNINEYKTRVVVPEMLIKLKQGFGRLIRTETDTGVVAILDSRVGIDGTYRSRVLDALPDCPVTAEIEDISAFMQTRKSLDYFR